MLGLFSICNVELNISDASYLYPVSIKDFCVFETLNFYTKEEWIMIQYDILCNVVKFTKV